MKIAQSCRDGLATLARTGRLVQAAQPVGAAVGGLAAPEALADAAPAAAADLDPLAIERMLGEVLTSTSRLRMPALLAFLR